MVGVRDIIKKYKLLTPHSLSTYLSRYLESLKIIFLALL